ncbi:unnamed protein product [Urochloa decumbens]|uniref:Uncharacterized protein n=1 Tax=Urochloa decumbens TaxID=240449 RepID=A0ABC8WHS5_9POAL
MAASMATLILFICALLCLVPTGAIAKDTDPCQDTDLTITTVPTGRMVRGQPEYKVTVDNQCSCAISDVVLSCPDGLSSTEPVDRTKIHVMDNRGMLCLLYNGWPVKRGSPVTFTYARSGTLGFTMYNATPNC